MVEGSPPTVAAAPATASQGAVAAAAAPALTTNLRRMVGRPFGVDERGRPIDHGSGKLIVGAIEYLQAYVGERAAREAPAGLSEAERADRVAQARSAALDQLVAMLNAAIA